MTTQRANGSKTFKVEVHNGSHHIMGLRDEDCGEDNTMLIHRYDAGDIDTVMTDKGMMHSALYDAYQVTDNLFEHDRFETEFGNFKCMHVHVVEDK